MTNAIDENTIIFIGLNKSSEREVKALREAGNKIAYIGTSAVQNTIKVDRTTYDLNQHDEVVAFVNKLSVSAAQKPLLVNAIEAGDRGTRDELAQLVQAWAVVEKSGKGPTRFIMSGHSNGISFWGEDNGSIDVEWIKTIAKILPRASGLVKDLYLSGCNSGRERAVMRWRETFPNIQTVWGYVDKSPGSDQGAIPQLKRWDVATRKVNHDLDAAIAAKTRLGQNVVVWTKNKGYKYQQSKSIADLLQRIAHNEQMYRAYYNGDLVVVNTGAGELREYYNDLLSLINNSAFQSSRLQELEVRMQTCLRVIYYDAMVKKNFAKANAELIKNGYKKIGDVPPDYSVLSRKKAIEAVNDFARKVTEKKITDPDVLKLRDVLVQGLVELKRQYIPDSWV